jgi:hypothetical protein
MFFGEPGLPLCICFLTESRLAVAGGRATSNLTLCKSYQSLVYQMSYESVIKINESYGNKEAPQPSKTHTG